MKRVTPYALIALLCIIGTLRAEWPEKWSNYKHHTEVFDRAMASYETVITTKVKMARDAYLTMLEQERKRSVATKRAKEVVAIDAEIRAVNVGSISGEPPENLPSGVLPGRKYCVEAPEKAEKEVASVRRHTQESYAKWLDDIAAAAAKGKDAELAAIVAAEKKRVAGKAEKAE
jgi:hypothetical protein